MPIEVEPLTEATFMMNRRGKLSPNQQDLVAFGQCIGCGDALVFEMQEEARFAQCCSFGYSSPLLRGDLVTVEDSEGQVWT